MNSKLKNSIIIIIHYYMNNGKLKNVLILFFPLPN